MYNITIIRYQLHLYKVKVMINSMSKCKEALSVIIMSMLVLAAGTVFAEQAFAEEVEVDNGLPVVYLTIDEQAEGYGTIEEMNTDDKHKTKCYGTFSVDVPDVEGGFHYCDAPDMECADIEDTNMEIRGRGNSTWNSAKKPYKIKLTSRRNVFGLGENKHWVLIANAFDRTLVKDRMTGWLGDYIGMAFTPRGFPVDLVMRNTDGSFNKYLGSYLLSENVRVDTNRVEIPELKEKDNDDQIITGGYLVQGGSQTDEDSPSKFYTRHGEWANHTPSFDPGDGDYENNKQRDYIRKYMQDVEDAIYASNFDADDGTSYRDLLDVTSAAKYWLVDQASKNGDGYVTGSTYLYKDRDKTEDGVTTPGKLYFGPLWDFDYAWRQDGDYDELEPRHEWVSGMLYDKGEGGFVEEVYRQWPAVKQGLIELSKDGGIIDQYYEETKKSQEQDYIINPPTEGGYDDEGGEDSEYVYEEEIGKLKTWIRNRSEWMDEHLESTRDLDDMVHKVIFEADGSVYRSEFYQSGEHLTEEDLNKYPEKDGWVFICWLDEDGQQVEDGYPVEEDVTLTAKYIPDSEATHITDIFFRDAYGAIQLKEEDCLNEYYIGYAAIPEDAQDKKIIWSSSDEDIAVVDEMGVVKAKAEGEVTITAKLKYSGVKKDFPIYIVSEEIPAPEYIEPVQNIFNLNLVNERYAQIQVSSTNVPAMIDSYEYESKNPSVVEVDDYGLLKAVGTGQAVVEVTTYTYPEGGAENAIMKFTKVLVNVFENEESPILNITKQPEDDTVNYPDGAEFSVKIDHPENIKEYQWEQRVYSIDNTSSFTIFQLDGSTARAYRRSDYDTFSETLTLTVPSTEYNQHAAYFRCVIVDIYGKKHISDEAVLTVNSDARKPVLYVGEYAVEPGETLDLEDTELGSGTVTYDSNGLDMTFDNVDIVNTHCVYDSSNAPGQGLFLYAVDDSKTIDERLEYKMYFKGDCRINNKYFDKEINSGGVTVNAYFGAGHEDYQPTLVIDGDSTLTVIGGKYSFYVHDGNIEIATDIRTLPLGSNYNHAIQAYNILIDPGVKADIKCCGPALLSTSGDIRISEGADLSIDAKTPHISDGRAALGLINSSGSIYCNGAKLAITGTGAPENTIPYNSAVAMLSAIACQGTLNLNDTGIDIDLMIDKWPETYAYNFYGINGGDFARMSMTNGSWLDINIRGADVMGACGIGMGGTIMVDPDCSINMMISSAHKVTGIITDGKLFVHDAIVDINLTTLSKDEAIRARTIGIDCSEADFDLSGGKGYIRIWADIDGVAIAAGGTEAVDDPIGYKKGYMPQYIKRDSQAKITIPKTGEVSSYSYELLGKNWKAETVYDLKDTSKPASDVCFGEVVRKKANPLTVKRKSKTVKIRRAKLKKKKQTISRKKIMSVSKGRGTVRYSLSSVSKKKYKKYFTINKKTGKVTVKKGLKKGKYRLTIRVTASGNDEYKKKSAYVKTTVRVY